jgi:hypothetical protein
MDPLTIFKNRLHHYTPLTLPSHFRECLSKNPALTIDMVLYDMKINPKYKHHWRFVYLAQVIPVEDLILNNILPITDAATGKGDLTEACFFKMKITMDTVLKTHTLVNYSYFRLIQHPNITIEDILAHPELPWHYPYILLNPNINFDYLSQIKKIHTIPYGENTFYTLSRNATFEQIIENPKEPWYPVALSSPYIYKHHFPALLDYFKKKDPWAVRTDKYLLIHAANANPNLTFEDLLDLFGDSAFRFAYHCKNFTLQDFQKYKSNPKVVDQWNYHDYCHLLSLETILAAPDIPWDYYKILEKNNTLTYEQVTTTPIPLRRPIPDPSLKQWHVKRHLFDNKHIPYLYKKRLLEELLQSIKMCYASCNYDSIFMSPLFLEPTFDEIKEYFAKKRIIRHIVECLTNPAYQQCRKRLLREHTYLKT